MVAACQIESLFLAAIPTITSSFGSRACDDCAVHVMEVSSVIPGKITITVQARYIAVSFVQVLTIDTP